MTIKEIMSDELTEQDLKTFTAHIENLQIHTKILEKHIKGMGGKPAGARYLKRLIGHIEHLETHIKILEEYLNEQENTKALEAWIRGVLSRDD